MARILLIDDDDAFRNALRLTLIHHGHTVTEARDGKEGIKLFPSISADLVITDIVMPEKEGLEVLMELKKSSPSVKVIAISGGGHLSAEDCLRIAQRMGAVKVLKKPFLSADIMSAINDIVPTS